MREFSPEEKQRVIALCEQMLSKQRFTPPPPEETDQWDEGGLLREDKNGVVFDSQTMWLPKAEADAWQRLRFRIPPETKV